ncbi:MAG: NUDIX hydrolase [Alphaproteobacteria bacterium]
MAILEALKKYSTSFEKENEFVQQTIDFIEKNENAFDRTNLSGHVNGSAWVLSKDGKKSLLNFHKKLNRWLQFGGHSDGCSDTWSVAFREAVEETGIQDIEFVTTEIFDVDVHPIPANLKKNEPEHFHYDIRFLLKANSNEFIISGESNFLKWVNNEDIPHLYEIGEINESMYRMYQKLNSL